MIDLDEDMDGTNMIDFSEGNIKATVDKFVAAVGRSVDAGHPAIAERISAVESALSAWAVKGHALESCEGVLGAASNLQTGLYDLNPEGLPHPYRDLSNEVTFLIEVAKDWKLDIDKYDEHIPDDQLGFDQEADEASGPTI